MKAITFRGSPNWKNGIPRNSKIRIVTLPDATVVYENDRVSEQVTVDLDPGYYHVVIKKFIGKNAAGRLSQIRWEQRFFHDLTEQEYVVLSNLSPKDCTARLISGGWTYFCSRCEFSCGNTIAMILHELEHKGLTKADLLKDSDYIMDQMESAPPIPTPSDDSPKKRGRPRAFHSES